ncbi:hypothetical protein P280DRAFT_521326 [Massarina eburnea CBS 473.64]|uniref:Vacuolar import and degradation protein-domain-containing protein n=1 Tax=Massarina eburnea CBS 473.64 TaxID=1395130 RepID=A0A6A6RPK7_9PLEO|nr:hypothetical protein P280DRAFT_521326 [Massarina eburnea CBS 473.64]
MPPANTRNPSSPPSAVRCPLLSRCPPSPVPVVPVVLPPLSLPPLSLPPLSRPPCPARRVPLFLRGVVPNKPPCERAHTPPSYISALSEALESPITQEVYNLATTLTTNAEDDNAAVAAAAATDESGLRYLRAAQDHDQWRLERSRERLRHLERERSELELHRDRGERLRRVMNRLGRLHDDTRAAYGDRVPNQNHLYDWSPANEANEADDEDELDNILAELRREQPNTHPEILRVLGRSQLDSERERSRAIVSRLLNSSQPSQSADSSLRSAAILQSVRRHPRFSARTRDPAQRPHADRDSASRSPHPSDWNDRYAQSASSRQAQAMQRLAERRTSLDQAREHARDRDMLARVDSYRRSYLDRASNTSSSVSPMLENTVQYLSRIRYSNSLDDSLNYALDAGFLSKDYFCDDHQDFVLDSFTIPPPPESSWLAPGAVLSGCQHATSVTSTVTTAGTGTSTTLYRFRNQESLTSTLFDPPSRPWLSNSYSSSRHRSGQAASPEIVTSHVPQQDQWPVKVTIHSVDYDRMSLSATMEAYNVPSHPHQHQSLLNNAPDGTTPFTRTSSITTYLEGEILDFNTHTLLTESFKSTPGNDATYWRKLPPFQMFSDEEMVRNLSSRRWFNDVLSKEWILMRWKERCFVKSLNRTAGDAQPPSDMSAAPAVSTPPTPFRASNPETGARGEGHGWGNNGTDTELGSFDDSGCGLTISGFYYVCLRRSDGKVEGLYYDPQSSPYQCLKLDSVRGGVFPAWGFR